jgi:hypothetical protein
MIRLKSLDCTVRDIQDNLVIEDGEDEDINRHQRVVREADIEVASSLFVCSSTT